MKRVLSAILTLCLVLTLCGVTLSISASADAAVSYQISGYKLERGGAKVTRLKSSSAPVDVTIYLTRTLGSDGITRVARGLDSFTGGVVDTVEDGGSEDPIACTQKFTIKNLTYSGDGQDLSFTAFYGSETQTFSLTIRECYTDAQQKADDAAEDASASYDTPTACPAPHAVFSIEPLAAPLAADQTASVKVTVYNAGTVTIKSPILTLTPSSALMLTGGVSAIVMEDIAPKKEKTVAVSVQTLSKIEAQNQGLECTLSFTYNNNISIVDGTASGTLTIPVTVSEEEKEETPEEKTAAPVPRIILAGYNCGGSVEAGVKKAVSFAFQNTSKTTAIENVLLTISSGSDLAISGSTNTFFFDSIEAGGTRSISVPFKAASVLGSSAQDIRLAFTYEYVDQKVRKSDAADLTVSVPLYQPDRFTIAEPKVASVGYVGEQNTITIDYVNKGKSEIYNLEAFISGDVDTTTPSVRVGNVEAGKSGTIAFAVCPYNEGANPVVITVRYEDANGEAKEQIFETSVEAMAYEEFDPGEWEEPIEEPTASFPWWIVGVVCAIITIVTGIVLSKKKKKAKLAAEAAMWDEWDDDKPAAPAKEKKETVTAAVEGKKE